MMAYSKKLDRILQHVEKQAEIKVFAWKKWSLQDGARKRAHEGIWRAHAIGVGMVDRV